MTLNLKANLSWGIRAAAVVFLVYFLSGCESRSSETLSHSPPSLVTVEEVKEMVSGNLQEIEGILPEGLQIIESSLKNAESGGGCIFRFQWDYRPPKRENWMVYWGINYYESGSPEPKAQAGILSSEKNEYVSPKLEYGKVYFVTLAATVSYFESATQSRDGKIVLRKFTIDLRGL